MCHCSPITFDFHALNIILSSQGDLLHLQGFINQLVMELVRRKDLRTFIQEKQGGCSILYLELVNKKEENGLEQVEQVLQQFSKMLETPKGLPPERELDHQINLKPGVEPFKLKPYRYPYSLKT